MKQFLINVYKGNQWIPLKRKLLRRSKILTFFSSAAFFILFLFFLIALTHVMGGSYEWVAGRKAVFTTPKAVSYCIPFIHNIKNNINKDAYIIMIFTILISIGILAAVIVPMILFKSNNKSYIHAKIITVFYTVMFMVSITYSIMLSTDKNEPINITKLKPIIMNIRHLIIFITISYIPTLFFVIHFLLLQRQKYIILGKDYKKIIKPNYDRQKIVKDIFSNVPKIKVIEDKNKENPNVFFDYTYFAKQKKDKRKTYIKNKRKEILFRQSGIWITILLICVPSVMQQLIYSSYNFVDKLLAINLAVHAYTAHYSFDTIVSSLNSASRFGSVVSNLMNGFTVLVVISVSLLFSYGYGRRNRQEVKRVVGNGIFNVVLVTVIITTLFISFAKQIILFQQNNSQGTSSLEYKMAISYVSIWILAYPLQIASSFVLTMLRSEGKALISFCILTVSFLINALFNWFLLTETNLGLSASAVATAMVYFLVLVIGLFFIFYDKNSWIRCSWSDLKPDGKIMKYLYIYGIINFVSTTSSSLSLFILNYIVAWIPMSHNDLAGDSNNIVNGIVQNFAAMSPWWIFFFSPIVGFTQGARNIMSYTYAAKKYDRYWQFIKKFYLILLLWTLFIVISVASYGQYLLEIFIRDSQLKQHAIANYKLVFIFISFLFVFATGSYVAIPLYQSMGQTNKSLLVSSLRSWIVIMPLMFICYALSWCAYDGNLYSNAPLYAFFGPRSLQDFIPLFIIVPLLVQTYKENKELIHKQSKKEKIDEEMENFEHLIKNKYNGKIKDFILNYK